MAYYTLLTTVGAAKLANAQVTGVPLQLTQIAVGDGNGASYEPNEVQVALVNQVWIAAINQIYVDANNANWMVFEGVVPEASGGWYVREVGIFDVDGDLFAIGKYPETYKPALAEGSAKDLYIRMILEISNTADVTLKIDPAIVLATRKYVDDEIGIHDADPAAHDGTMLKTGKHAFFIPAAYITPAGANPCGGLAYHETDSNLVKYPYRAFEAAAVSAGQFGLALPPSWDGLTVEYGVLWSHPVTTVDFGVTWRLKGVSVGDGEVLDAAFGAGVDLQVDGGATDEPRLYWSGWSGAVTIAGAGTIEEQMMEITREVTDANDSLAVEARFHKVFFRPTFNAGTDA